MFFLSRSLSLAYFSSVVRNDFIMHPQELFLFLVHLCMIIFTGLLIQFNNLFIFLGMYVYKKLFISSFTYLWKFSSSPVDCQFFVSHSFISHNVQQHLRQTQKKREREKYTYTSRRVPNIFSSRLLCVTQLT